MDNFESFGDREIYPPPSSVSAQLGPPTRKTPLYTTLRRPTS